jgi:hypothetical protein
MAIPENHSPVEHLHDLIRKKHNQEVRRFFKNQKFDEPAGTPKEQAAYACLMKDEDNAETMIMRKLFFEFDCGHARSNLVIYNGSREDIAPPVTGHPKIYLFFSQDLSAVTSGSNRLESELSFRLMTETQATFTPAKAKELAQEIKTQFLISGKGYRFDRGKVACYMKDPINGFDYRRRIYVRVKSEAVEIYRKIYAAIDKTFDADKVMAVTPDKNSSTTEGTHIVYGETTPKPGYRPTATVEFRKAYVEIPGRKKPVFLIDRTLRNTGLVSWN